MALKALIVAGMTERIVSCMVNGDGAGARTFATVAAETVGLARNPRGPLARGPQTG